ncbi:SMC family ATPase [Nocardioides sp. KIGAM211]|uniref:Nuclease SbcCD subunit C n=1 Tax=Nocardioides luti TaxID=2761101 RepID=A0A7X0RCF5_9ACTN|nr:SMC family ATPase [Nocardioides luti]MBB6625762.1 SMC family ATPase [Nocardioides luti]
MRLHQLEVTGFGPFAETVSVDFDRLSDAGLFLLTGPTGSGKTSVLDAVCFALYGDVPGDRNAAKRLRADQAAPGVAPRVTLETTLSGRRFRISRSPAWERPKKRGTGTTTEQASVTITERVDGAWQPLSSRLDETGHLVTALVGMNVTQFTQVAMLPQGRFQAFLRARSDERHRLLQQLFRTGRFDEVERWFKERRSLLRRRSEASHQRVADLVSRVSEATEVRLPADWDIRDLLGPAADGTLLTWATGLRDAALTTRASSEADAETAAGAETVARDVLDEVRTTLEQRRRVEAAAAEQQALLAAADDHARGRDRVDAARRAAGVLPLHRIDRTARTALERAAGAAEAAGQRAADALGLLMVDEDTLTEALQRAVDDAARVRAALPRQQTQRRLTREIAEARARQEQLGERRDAVARARAALPERLLVLRRELVEATAAGERVAVEEERLAALDARVTAYSLVGGLTRELADARADLAVAQAEEQVLREAWLDLREARLEGMAAEIAGALAVGACCPVCGSAEHPHKAARAEGAPDAAAEKAALKRLDTAKSTTQVHDEQVRTLATALAVATGNAGPLPLDELQARAAAVREGAERLRALADGLPAAREALEEAEAASERLLAEVAALDRESAALTDTVRARTTEHTALKVELDGLLDGARDLATQLDRHLERAAAGRAALQALAELAAATTAADEARAALAAAVSEAGFATPEEAAGAALPADDLRSLERTLADHERRLAAVTAVLADEDAAGLLASPTPDVPAAQRAHAAALAALGDARSRAGVWATRVERLTTLADDLATALDDWAPLREELDLTTRLATFVDGKSPDNRLQMRLSAYVLAYRLTQVVAAANERLAQMSDRRYSLEHTGRRGAGETRGGLSLLVRDDWSGEARDPATLSGGETFVVSLALALGLADVITQESGDGDRGDSRLDTLFVDEGFGSLDADTLDDVMDTLDSLRDGGRIVGVVSHVAEMRDRIPTQLRVSKARTGSTLALSR